MTNYQGQCSCGKIQFTCTGEPLFTQYCHCNKCREIASMSENNQDKKGYSFTAAYLTSNFNIIQGEEGLEGLVRNTAKLWLCSICRSLIYGIALDPAKQGGIGINANNISFPNGLPDSYKPLRHVWYADRRVDFNDQLPKFKDAPKEQFGSGELLIPNDR